MCPTQKLSNAPKGQDHCFTKSKAQCCMKQNKFLVGYTEWYWFWENKRNACFGEMFLQLKLLLKKFPIVFLVRRGGLIWEHSLSLTFAGPKPSSTPRSHQEKNLHYHLANTHGAETWRDGDSLRRIREGLRDWALEGRQWALTAVRAVSSLTLDQHPDLKDCFLQAEG